MDIINTVIAIVQGVRTLIDAVKGKISQSLYIVGNSKA